MKLLIGILLSMSLSTQALANHDNVVAESDTGMVYSTLSCKGVDFEITNTRVNKDYFDYLEARVDFEVECVDDVATIASIEEAMSLNSSR